MHMVKTLTIRDEVYNRLSKMKRGGESFSELFLELLEKKRFTGDELRAYAGILSEREYRKLKGGARKARAEASASVERRVKKRYRTA